MILRFSSGSMHAGECVEEAILRLDVDQFDTELAGERLFDLFALVLSHQTGVDEDAGELAADGLGDERGGDGGVDAAGERTEHPFVADLCANRRDLVFDDRRVGPRRRNLGHLVQEVREELLAPLGVSDLGMELHGVETSRHVLHHRDGRLGRRTGHDEAFGRGGDGVPVTHPARHARRPLVHQHRASLTGQRRAAVLADAGVGDVAAELLGHELRAVTDARARECRVRRSPDRARAPELRRPTSDRQRG